MLNIRQSCDRLIFNMGIPIPGKDSLYTEGIENAYLPKNVHFQNRPLGYIDISVVAGSMKNASRWLDERIRWCPLFGGVLSQVRAQAREDALKWLN